MFDLQVSINEVFWILLRASGVKIWTSGSRCPALTLGLGLQLWVFVYSRVDIHTEFYAIFVLHFGVEYLAIVLSSCSLLPKVGSSRAVIVHALPIRSARFHAHSVEHGTSQALPTAVFQTCPSTRTRICVRRAIALAAISWVDGVATSLTQVLSGSQ